MNAVQNTQSVLDVIKKQAASEKMNLPVFPGAAFELQQLLADDNTSMDQVAKVIGKDQTLATQVLKLANSSFFSGMNTVRTIREAIMRLGLNHVFNLVICTSQQNYYKSSNSILDKYLQASWKHALCTAIGSKWLVQKIGYRKLSDEAFLAGLLHDIGKLLLLKAIEKVSLKEKMAPLTDSFILEALDAMHADQGYKLMNEWSIPSVYCNVAKNHHNEDFEPGDTLLLSVRVVNKVCRKAGISTSPAGQVDLAALPEVHALVIKGSVLAELQMVIEKAVNSDYGA